MLSFHDTGGRAPEKVYQAFALGVLTRMLPRYDVDSNREGGLGRYDILVVPRRRGEPGAVLEFKVARAATPQAVRACHGKQVWVRRAGERGGHTGAAAGKTKGKGRKAGEKKRRR